MKAFGSLFGLCITISLILLLHFIYVLLHELSHAIPAALFSRKQVDIYIGSYGKPEKNFSLNIGLLNIYIAHNSLFSRKGLCFYAYEQVTFNQQIIITLCGALVPFIIALSGTLLAFKYKILVLTFIFALFLLIATYHLFLNLVPRNSQTVLDDGRQTYNDGRKIKGLLYQKKAIKEWEKAAKLVNRGEYKKGTAIMFKMLSMEIYFPELYTTIIRVFVLTKDYTMAHITFANYGRQEQMTEEDFQQIGYVYSKLKQDKKALTLYEKVLAINPDNEYALMNIGFTYNVLERYEEAIVFFNKALAIDKDSAYCYSNRGFSKLLMNDFGEGLKDIYHALKLDPNEPYAHRNLGLFYLKQKEYPEALASLERAKALNNDVEDIEALLSLAREKS